MSNETIQNTQEILKRIIYPTWDANKTLEEINGSDNKQPFVFHAKNFPVGMKESDAYKKGRSIFMNYPKMFYRLDNMILHNLHNLNNYLYCLCCPLLLFLNN